MGIRKISAFILIIVISLCSYIYLSNMYNPSGVEMYLSSSIKYDKIQKIESKNGIESCSLNYRMPYLNNMLIMTTGFDTQFKEIELTRGRLISDINRKEAAIGDKVADRYFKTDKAVGRKISIFGENYEVVGIIKKSDKIYIPFQTQLSDENWQKRIFRFDTLADKVPYLLLENVQNDLKTLGVGIDHIVINRVKIYAYIDIIIFLALYALAVVIKKYYIKLKKEMISLKSCYDMQRRSIEWYRYLLARKKVVLMTLRDIASMILIIWIALQFLKYIELSQVIIPENFFSLNSYIEILKRLFSILLYQLQYGFSDISIDIILINTIIFIVILHSAFRTRRVLH